MVVKEEASGQSMPMARSSQEDGLAFKAKTSHEAWTHCRPCWTG